MNNKNLDGTIQFGGGRSRRTQFRHQTSQSAENIGRLRPYPKPQRRGADGSVDRLQFLARFEAYRLARRDRDFGAGARVGPDAGLARANVENAEAAQFDAVSLGQRALHAFENRLDGELGFGFGDPGLVHYFVDDVELDHGQLPRGITDIYTTK